MSIPDDSTKLLLDPGSCSESVASPPSHPPAIPAPGPITALSTPALLTPITAAASVPETQNTLGAMAEQPPAEPTGGFLQLVKPSRVGEVILRNGKILGWGRPTDQEALLGQARGKHQEVPCKSCQEGDDGPFTSCAVVSGEFSGSCTSCHYSGLGSSCSFRSPKRKRSPSSGEIATSGTELKPTARATKVCRRDQAEAFRTHWDGLSEILRDLICEKLFE